MQTLGEAIRTAAQRSPDHTALVALDGSSVSYRELDRQTDRIANAILGAGIARGERVAIWMANSVDYLFVYLACLKSGHIVVQLNIRHTEHEADFQLEDSGCTAIFFDDSTAARVERLSVDRLRLLVTAGAAQVCHARLLHRFAAAGASTPVPAEVRSKDIAVLAYTSGTTGFPKGAQLTHASMLSIAQTNMVACRYALRSTGIFPLSLSFAAGIPAHVIPHLLVGGTLIVMESWDTELLVDSIDRMHAEFTLVPTPPIAEFCEVVTASRTSLDSLVSVLHSTARAPEEQLELLVETIGPRLVEGWGMTENSGGLVAATNRADYALSRPRVFSSTGTAVPGAVVRLIDEDGAELPHDGSSVGQLVFRSNSLASGYWSNPEASARAFTDGWYHSGDLGAIDEDGYIYVVDRRTDLIISGGMNVYPSEVERVLMQHPDVQGCAVVGVPHERWGQSPVAFVVPRNGITTADSIGAYCRDQLAGYKQPRKFILTDSLPTNAGGKVSREGLRRQAAES